jgi:hypothetical protein
VCFAQRGKGREKGVVARRIYDYFFFIPSMRESKQARRSSSSSSGKNILFNFQFTLLWQKKKRLTYVTNDLNFETMLLLLENQKNVLLTFVCAFNNNFGAFVLFF